MKKILSCFIAILILSTCAQKGERQPDGSAVTENSTSFQSSHSVPEPEIVGQEVVIKTDAELRYALDELIIKAKLSEDQKAELYSLRVDLGQKLERNTVMNVKLRSMMVDEMMSENGSQQGVNMIGEMINKNITERITLIEQSIEKVNTILGFKGQPRQEVQNTQNQFY